MLMPIGDSQRYMVCVQFHGNGQVKNKVAIYFGGMISQFIDSTPEQCGAVAYHAIHRACRRAAARVIAPSMTQLDSDVLIVGAGPTGLTLAIDLGRRGVRCTLIEQKERPAFLPKMERINARSMEIYRRMGLARKNPRRRLAARLSDGRLSSSSRLTEPPLLHLPYPSVDEARANTRASNDGTLPLEPYQLISQYTLEPLLKSVAETLPAVTVRYGCEFLSLRQDGEGVTARVQTAGGGTQEIRAAYLVGCDGGASPVRSELGIALSGEGNLLGLRQALFRCDELFDRMPIGNGPGHGRHYHVADDKSTFLIMQDSDQALDAAFRRRHRRRDEGGVRASRRRSGEIRDAVLRAVAAESAARRPLRQGSGVSCRRCRASRHPDRRARHEFRRRRRRRSVVEACRDAGRLGRPGICSNPTRSSAARSATAMSARRATPPSAGANGARCGGRTSREDSPAGAATRKNLAAVADVEQRKSNEMIGAELGYRYVNSPVICNIPGGPEHLFREYQPTTWPGARLPHVWLDDGTPMQDRIRRRLYDPQTRRQQGRCRAGSNARIRSRGAPVDGARHPGPHRARHLRLRSHFGAARHARRLARQCGAGGSGARGGYCYGEFFVIFLSGNLSGR